MENNNDDLNDIIFLFRKTIESTNVELAKFSLRKMLNGTIAAIRLIAEDENIDLREKIGNDIYDIITGDRFQIRAVLTQLVGSAIMHSTSKVRVSIDFFAS